MADGSIVRRHPRAVVVMARAPWMVGKTRLVIQGDESAHRDLREALFRDTLDVAVSVAGAQHVVACEPPEAVARMRAMVGLAAEVVPQRGIGLGDRLAHVFEDALGLGAASVVVIGSDLPNLPARLLQQAFEVMRADRARVVLGPATDGGYYLVGMTRATPVVFEGIDWGTAWVLEQTLDAARAAGVSCALLEPWRDIDHASDLDRLVREPASGGAARTRAWCERQSPWLLNDPSPPR